jgi:hypothetical protein
METPRYEGNHAMVMTMHSQRIFVPCISSSNTPIRYIDKRLRGQLIERDDVSNNCLYHGPFICRKS